MYFFIFLLCGIFLVIASIYILIKTQQQKDTIADIKKTYKGILAVFLIGIASVGIAFVVRTVDGPSKQIPQAASPDAWKTKDNKTMAYVMIQDFVKDRLKNPGSAKFEWITEPDCTITKDGFDYRINSWVDSQNDFGVMVRTRFSGVVRQMDKDNWELEALDFGE